MEVVVMDEADGYFIGLWIGFVTGAVALYEGMNNEWHMSALMYGIAIIVFLILCFRVKMRKE